MLLPHRNLIGDETAVRATGWRHEGEAVSEHLPWQPGLDLELQCEMSIDTEAAAKALCFDPADLAEVVVEWTSDTTRLRESVGRFDVSDHVELTITLPGNRIGGTVTLHRRLVTRVVVDPEDPFAPSVPGALLWEDRTPVRIEGRGAQFAVLTTSFSGSGLDGDAAWALRIPRGEDIDDTEILAEPASEHVGVRLNGDHPLGHRIATGAPDDEAAGLARSIIICEMAAGLVSLAPALPVGQSEFEEGSLGALINTTLRRIGVESAAELEKFDREQISAIVQGRFLDWGVE